MAIVIAPAMSQQASGNIGSINFTRWRGINVARTTYVPDYTPSGKQNDQRDRMKWTSQRWGSWLTALQREKWVERAAEEIAINRIGGEYRPSGYQLFMKINVMILFMGALFLYEPPPRPPPVYVWRMRAIPDPFFNANEVNFEKRLTVAVDADGFQIYKAGPYNSGGRHPILPEYGYLTSVWYNYYYHDYDVIDTKWYWYKCRWFFQTGYVGNWWEAQVQTDFPF